MSGPNLRSSRRSNTKKTEINREWPPKRLRSDAQYSIVRTSSATKVELGLSSEFQPNPLITKYTFLTSDTKFSALRSKLTVISLFAGATLTGLAQIVTDQNMSKDLNPYSDLPARNFWSPAVGKREVLEIDELWVPKWPVKPTDKVVTFGSCFAQHFGRALLERGYDWTNMEAPPIGLGDVGVEKFNYNVFSARTGNIYTTNILRQWCEWATGLSVPPDEIWESKERFYDPFRPAIEPDGFETAQELRDSRDLTIEAFGNAMRNAELFVFTLGLTESWRSADHAYEYAICPGTVAGEFDARKHVFVNETYPNILKSLEAALAIMQRVNPALRILLTVSPVPLTATATDDHVLVATTYSKSVLRAVAGDVATKFDTVDYFPSYEIITAPPFGGRFFAENKRSVLNEGVAHVMTQFFKGQVGKYGSLHSQPRTVELVTHGEKTERAHDNLVCEESLLAAFGPRV